MATQDANIAVKVGGDVTDLQTAMEKGAASVKRFAGMTGTATRDAVNSIGKVGGVLSSLGVAVSAGGLFMLAKQSSSAALEIQNLSRVANTGVVEFQRMAAAAAPLGVEQDKLADILKDVNDRVGDFIQSGGGEMRDFFENIAPKVGVTAQEFRNLSGPAALQLYYSSLEKANLSQADMTFYLEAMANDLTLLEPMLRNNGKQLKEVSGRAEDLGLILSEVDVQRLASGSQTFTQLGKTFSTVGSLISVELIPYITLMVERLFEAANQAGGFKNITVAVANTAIRGFGKVADMIQGLRVVFKGVELVAVSFGAAVTSVVELAASGIAKFIDATIYAVNAAIGALNKLPKVDIATVDPFSESAFMQGLHSMGDSARLNVSAVRSELHNLATQEMPSSKVEKFLGDVAEKSKAAALELTKLQPGQALATEESPSFQAIETENKDAEDLEKLKEKYLAEQTLLLEHNEAMRLIGEEWDKSKFETEEQWRAVRAAAETDFYGRMRNIANSGYQGIQSVISQRWGAIAADTAGALQSIVGTMATGSKKAFEVSKAWALADALISTYQGIAAGVRLGWPQGIPAVAWAAATGFAQVTQIRNQKYGGAGGAAASGRGSPGEAPNPVGVGGSSSAPSSGDGQGALISFSGIDPSKIYDGRQMIAVIQEAIDNGARVGLI